MYYYACVYTETGTVYPWESSRCVVVLHIYIYMYIFMNIVYIGHIYMFCVCVCASAGGDVVVGKKHASAVSMYKLLILISEEKCSVTYIHV